MISRYHACNMREKTVSGGAMRFASLSQVPLNGSTLSRRSRAYPFTLTEYSTMRKYLIAAVLLVIIAALVWLVWIQTKLLAVTLGLLILFLIALYFVLKKM